MSTTKPQRSPAEIEDIILRKILLVTLHDSMETDPRIVYLRSTADEFSSQGMDPRLSRVSTERVLIDRLSGSFRLAEPPFLYLVGCYRRALEESKKIANMKNQAVRSEMECAVDEAKKLSVSYCRMHLGNPDLFPDVDVSPAASSPSPLLPLIFSEVSPSGLVDGFGGAALSPPGFLRELLEDSDYDSLKPIMDKLYQELRDKVLQESVEGNFQQPLSALLFLVRSPIGAKCLVNHPYWIPKIECLNGRDLEMMSILGPFFRVSAVPEETTFNGHCLSPFKVDKAVVSNLHECLKQVVLCLLHNSETRENVLQYLGELINKNRSRANIQVNPATCASSGMFVNLSAVMLRLCEPFLDVNMSKLDKIDPTYVFYGTRLNLKGLTALNASSEEVLQLSSSSAAQAKHTFICECFFMTARVLNLGILKAISEYRHLLQDLTRCEEDLSTFEALQSQSHSPQLDSNVDRIKEEHGFLSQVLSSYESEICREIHRALSFYQLMVVWLVRLVGGFQMKMPSICPKEFASMPEHFVEDVMELLIFASNIPKALDGVLLDDFMNFIIMFMGSPDFIRNPYLRAKMVKVLNCWIPRKSVKSATFSLFEGNQLPLQYLVGNLLKLYVDVEFTGSQAQFGEKFTIRHDITKLLEYLWNVPFHRNAWERVAKEEEKGVYLNFLNSLINDSIYLVDGSLNRILQIKEIEAEMANTTEWEKKPAQEREKRIQLFHSSGKMIKINMELADEDINMLAFTSEKITSPFLLPEMVERVASMLNYFLLKLVGQSKSFRLNHPKQYKFHPEKLINQIVTIYVNLDKGDGEKVFPDAIIKDGRSYSEQLFGAASALLRRIGGDERTVKEFVELSAKAKVAAAEVLEAEAALGEIPEEFLDPISCTLMMDPVYLPTSRNTMDRHVIERHLLSNSTDPFSRSYLTSDMLIPNTELKARIDEFVRRSRHNLMS